MHFILHMPVIADALGKLFDRFIQGTDVIASGRFLDEEILAFKNVTVARHLDNGSESSPLVCIRQRIDIVT
jgi:hypothetical protein